MRRSMAFMLQPRSMNSTASQSSSSGCDGFSPCAPKSSEVRTRPRPKNSCQIRLTMTRAGSGFSRETIQRARANRGGTFPRFSEGRTARVPGSTFSPGWRKSPPVAMCFPGGRHFRNVVLVQQLAAFLLILGEGARVRARLTGERGIDVLLFDRGPERHHLVILALADGVELMVMALGATDGEAEPDG